VAKVFLNKSLLLTRPLEESFEFSRSIHILNKNINFSYGPLFQIESLHFVESLLDIDGLIVTSANSIRSLKKSQVQFSGPIFCVGDSTAELAKKAGFFPISASGNSQNLVELIHRTVKNKSDKLIYFRGTEVFSDLAKILVNLKHNVDEVVCYRKLPIKLTDKVKKSIANSSIVGGVFFSRQTVELFSDNIKYIPKDFIVFCISEEVSRIVKMRYPGAILDVRISKLPNLKEICKLVVAAPEFVV
jgi:uroporphyrinogen-III synthase